jgi:hypothetical protein
MKIWKFPMAGKATFGDTVSVMMPGYGAKIIHWGHGRLADGTLMPNVWAEVDPDQEMRERQFKLLGTRFEVPEGERFSHVVTWFTNGFVFHLYAETAYGQACREKEQKRNQ